MKDGTCFFIRKGHFCWKRRHFFQNQLVTCPSSHSGFYLNTFLNVVSVERLKEVGVQNYTPSYKFMNNLKPKDVGYLP